MTEVKWIKIVVDIFDDEKIKLIEALPDGDSIIVCWFKLLCLAGRTNNSGVLFLADSLPYTDEMLATVFRRPLQTVRLALATFEQFRMVEIINGVITIPNWEKHQTLDEMEKVRAQTRERVSRYREKQKALVGSNVTEALLVTASNGTDIEVNKEQDKDLDLFTVMSKWNELGLNSVRDIKGNRKTLLQARIKEHGLDAVLEALDKVADSDFLHGQNNSGWTITFDWFVRPQNFQKVLEGNYVNRKKKDQVVKDEHFLDDLLSLHKPKRDLDKLLDDLDKI